VELDPPLVYGDTVQLRLGESLYSEVINIAEGSAGRRDRSLRFLRPYLEVPATVSWEVRRLAWELAQSGDPLDVLRSIERHLTVNYTYSLNPERIGSSDDFVAGFLFDTREGFCVHFATSFVILARLNNIPARYVTGFLAMMPDDGSPAIVTGEYAHAWPEVWIEGEGWVPWEATRPLNRDSYTPLGDELASEFDIDLDRETARQLRAVLGSEVRSGEEPNAGGAGLGQGNAGVKPIRMIGILATAFGLFGGIYLWVRSRRGKTIRLEVRFGPQGRLHRRTRRLVRLLGRRGVPPPSERGWVDWGQEVGRRFPGGAEAAREYCDLLCAHLYGGEELDPSWVRSWKRIRNLAS
jgi:hypothetical protein